MSPTRSGLPAAEEAPASAVACPMCGATLRVRDESLGEEHCAECGLVFNATELVTRAPFVRSVTGSDGSGRGIGPFVGIGGETRRALGSTLSGSRDGQGRPLGWARRYEFQHLRRVMQRQTARVADGPLDRSQARTAIVLAGERLGLPAVVVGEAERLFREGAQHALFRGRNLPSCVGATVYAACRTYAIPRTLGETSKAVGARRAEVGRAFKVLHRGLSLSAPVVSTRSFLARYAEELALSSRVRNNVEAMLEEAKDDPELSGLPAHGLVAALIYLAADRQGEHRSRAQVARVSAVTEVTLRSTSRLLEGMFGRRRAPPGDG
ncbi:MAG TPA: transcription initiation factor IIB family protein [Thermoplasmata archaeon]|nr:transcription initiation factor IIB family protein [Thermoplasmata archaeon]